MHSTDPGQPEVIAIDLDDYLDHTAAAKGAGTATAESEAHGRAERGRRDRAALRQLHTAQRCVDSAIGQADAKATSLLGLFGVALAAALVLGTRAAGVGVFAVVVLILAVAPLLGSVVALLSVLRARLDGDHGLSRWVLYEHNPDALIDYLTLPTHCRVQIQAHHLVERSTLAMVKFRRVNLAVTLLAAALPLLALAALTTTRS